MKSEEQIRARMKEWYNKYHNTTPKSTARELDLYLVVAEELGWVLDNVDWTSEWLE